MTTASIQNETGEGFEYGHAVNRRVLEPIERISEVLFGLIMVLTFTCSFSVAEAGRAQLRTVLLAALGCNLAWGTIDAIMYLMGCLADRARAIATVRAVQNAKVPEKAQRHIARAFSPIISTVVSQSILEEIRRQVIQLPEPPTHPRLSKRDWVGAAGVFLLVFISTFPVVVPFLFIQKVMLAKRISNAVAIGMLFLTGYAFGRCTGYHSLGVGIAMVVVGGLMVGLTILLGG